MSSSVFDRRALVGALTLSLGLPLAGCQLDPEAYQYGFVVTSEEFSLYNEVVGVHPNPDILLDPNNPFAEYGVGGETKWDILAGAGSVATFYAWGTILAGQPTGEHQFFTAQALANIYRAELAPDDQLEDIRLTAIAGFQAQLDNFPEAITFSESGEDFRRLSTDSFKEIISLDGQVLGDWELVTNSEGDPVAVRSSSIDPGRASDEDDPTAGIGEGINND